MQNPLEDWMERQVRFSATAMLRAISATELVRHRPAFGQAIRPAPGSVLASPELGLDDPNPDYFFHWLRDSSLVIDALRVSIEDGMLGTEALEYFNDFVEFSLSLNRLDGPALLRLGDFRQKIDPELRKYLRNSEDLNTIVGDLVLGEVRFAPDGTLDIFRWARPQNDGPALRALTLLRFWRLEQWRPLTRAESMRALLEADLAFTCAHWREPCYDLWEEQLGRHYHTRLVQHAALKEGAEWSEAIGEAGRAQVWREAAREIASSLEEHFDALSGAYLTPAAVDPNSPHDPFVMRLDIAVILGVIHADASGGAHSVLDPRVLSTMVALEELFAMDYPINRKRAADCAPAMGRYPNDQYFTGGAYYFSTLGAAQFYYRFARAVAAGATLPLSPENRGILASLLTKPHEPLGGASLDPQHRAGLFKALIDRGDMFMAMVRVHAPDSGELAEQFSQFDGAPASARNLAWSYAGFITAVASRKSAVRQEAVSVLPRAGRGKQFE